MVEVEVFRVWLDPRPEQAYVVMFREANGDRAIPMAVGVHEARAIQMGLDGVELERPLTHDLIVSAISDLGARVARAELREFRDGTYYAYLVLSNGTETIFIDARPSDCTALALRCNAPIFASDEVFDAAEATLVEHDGGFSVVAGQDDGPMGERTKPVPPDAEIFRQIISDVDLDDDDGQLA